MSQALVNRRELIARGARLPNVALVDPAIVAVGACLLVTGVGAAAGGYFPTSWGWTALALLWALAIALLLRGSIAIGRLDGAFVGALAVFGGWIWLSTTWSESTPRSFYEGQRVLVYVAAGALAVLLVRVRSVAQLLGGVLTGLTLLSGYGLATRLFPNRLGSFDPIAGYRLEEPVGYWNALGILAAMGALLGLGVAARGSRPAARAAAAASLALLLPTLYFTYSRGSWVAFGAGLLLLIVYEPGRLQLVTSLAVALLVPAVEVLVASRTDALTHKNASIGAATHAGERFALVVVAGAVAAAALVVLLARVERRVTVPHTLRIAYTGLLVALAVATIGGGIARYGSPITIVGDTYDRFSARPAESSANLNERLFNISGNGRAQLWKVAWQDYQAHPWLGSGAGTYELEWYKRRPIDDDVRDAHNLYVEQLAELGPFGLALLALVLALPLVAALRARGSRFAGAATAAYVAFLLHAAVDWDWEVMAVTLTGLLCGVALLASARREPEQRPFPSPLRFGAVGVVAALGTLAFVGLIGNLAVAASNHAAGRRDWPKAAAEARRAADWAPWSSLALRLEGEAELERGNRVAATIAFRRALAKDPGDWETWQDLYASASGAEAQMALRKTNELNPRGLGG
jgi:O-Antigen ligase